MQKEDTLAVRMFAGTNLLGFRGFLVEFEKLNTRKIFLEVVIAKIFTREKILKSKILKFFHSWKRQIIFLAPSFFDLRFHLLILISLLSSSLVFFAPAILPLLPSFLHSLLKGKSKQFLCSLVRYKVRLAASHIELKVGGWQHFYSSSPSPHMELQALLEPSPPTTTGCKPSTKKIELIEN